MKRVYLLFAMLLGFAAIGIAQDQKTCIGNIKADTKITGDFSADKVYVLLGNAQDGNVGTVWLYDNGETPRATKNDSQSTLELKYGWVIKATTEASKYLFINKATGNYIHVKGTGNGGAVVMSADEVATILTIGEEGNADYVALKNPDADQWIDLGWGGSVSGNPTTWGGSVAGSRRFQIFEAEVIEDTSDPRTPNVEAMLAVYTQYSNSATTWEEEIGTERGNVQRSYYDALTEALGNAEEIYDLFGRGKYEGTAEDIDAAKKAIEDAAAAVEANRIPFALDNIQDGYYALINCVNFTTKETKTGTYTQAEADAFNEEHAEEIEAGTVEPASEGESYNITVTKHVLKGMKYGGTVAKWGTLEKNPVFAWQITKKEAYKYELKNVFGKSFIQSITQSANATMSQDTTVMAFDWAGEPRKVYTGSGDEQKDVQPVNIRLSSGAVRGYQYAHAGGHGGGAGTDGTIVGWNWEESGNASDWYLMPIENIDEWMVGAEDIKKAESMIAEMDSVAGIINDQITIAKDDITELNKEIALITDAAQFSSPFSQNDLGNKDGQDLSSGCLIDGNTDTFWHSYWGGGGVTNGTHYLQIKDIELPQGTNAIAFEMVRRSAANDHVTKFSIYGYEEDNVALTKEEGHLLATINFPNPQSGATAISDPFEIGNYRIIRAYAEEEQGSEANNRGYWHAAEIQLYPATLGTYHEKNQYDENKLLADAVVAARDAWTAGAWSVNKYMAGEQTMEQITDAYSTFKAANDAWAAVYADPAALRAALEANKNNTGLIVKGNNPGEWSSNNVADFAGLLASLQTFDESGKYAGQADMDAKVASISSTMTANLTKANPVVADKWYMIHFATETQYEANNWDKSGAKAAYAKGDDTQEEEAGKGSDDIQTSPALFGKYLAVGSIHSSYTDEKGNGYEVIRHDDDEKEYTDSVVVYSAALSTKPAMGDNIVFTEKEKAAYFRFVQATDSTYYIQEKATGMYLTAPNGASKVVLSNVNPITVNAEALGFGAMAINAFHISGEAVNQLHAERSTNSLVTWGAKTIGSNTMLFIENADVEGMATLPTEGNIKMWPGQFYSYTFPTEVTFPAEVEVYQKADFKSETIQNEEGKNVNWNKVVIEKSAQTVPAGAPCIVRYTGDYTARAEALAVYLKEQSGNGKDGALTRQEAKEYTEEFDADNYKVVTVTRGDKFVTKTVSSNSLLVGSLGTVTTVPEDYTSVVFTGNTTSKEAGSTFGAYIAVPTANVLTAAPKWGYEIGTVNVVDPTGIEMIEIEEIATEAPATIKYKGIYSITGQKLSAPVKGINIINGKKVIF